MKKYVMLLGLCIALFACSEDKLVDETITSENSKGELKTQGDGKYDLLGYGYDITQDFVSDNSKKQQVIDVEEFIKSSPKGTFDNPFIGGTTERSFFGSTATMYSKSMEEETKFDGSVAMKALGQEIGAFSAAISNGKSSQYEYSSKYSFTRTDIVKRQRNLIVYAEPNEMYNYLMPIFKKEIDNLTLATQADKIVKDYGTHVMLDITIGGMYKAIYESAITEETSAEMKKKAQSAAVSLNLGLFGFKLGGSGSSQEQQKWASKNGSWSMEITCYGGTNSGRSYTINADNSVVNNVNQAQWEASVDDTHCKLVDLNFNRTYPIWDFVSDPVKKEMLKKAVQRYIESNKLKVLNIIPTYVFYNVGQNHLLTTESDIDKKYANWQNRGVNCYILKDKGDGNTIPLYLYYNDKGFDHLTTTDSDIVKVYKEWVCQGILGYIYKTKEPDTVPIYEYYSPLNNNHFTTIDPNIIRDYPGWTKGSILGYVYK